MVDKVVGEELSDPILEARLDVILEVKLDASGFTVENIEFCNYKDNWAQNWRLHLRLFMLNSQLWLENKPVYLGPTISDPAAPCS